MRFLLYLTIGIQRLREFRSAQLNAFLTEGQDPAGLLRPSVADENMTCTKLRLRQQQQARYYNRGVRDLDPLGKGYPVRVLSLEKFERKEWQKGMVKKRLDEGSYEVELPKEFLSHSLKVSCLKPMSCRPKLRPKLRLKVRLKFIRPLLLWKHPS